MLERSVVCPCCKRTVRVQSDGRDGLQLEPHSMHPIASFVASLFGPVPGAPVVVSCFLSLAPVEVK